MLRRFLDWLTGTARRREEEARLVALSVACLEAMLQADMAQRAVSERIVAQARPPYWWVQPTSLRMQ